MSHEHDDVSKMLRRHVTTEDVVNVITARLRCDSPHNCGIGGGGGGGVGGGAWGGGRGEESW
uniref:CBS domain-containing protein n=1 Tax=Echinococcus granulosus TaxID=6210 RepID=A0A068WRD7_ECHGR|nr:hypothetical protein EgrG_000353800 [Echinococcus granulosus]